ncbi:hypothetical protein J2Z19_000469 [Ensifer adhaerens]|uniref:Uncharacterized protein n=1 Tax=Ensifer adhaerens TaxID=106592 RepID=A0ACC5SPE2_ENSAD|nr:hypothetical protein [Ensifer adhaerens]MBP1870772.1 hypothetical protein [Ensifer adhaerens]
MLDTYAVKWSADQPGEYEGHVLHLGLSRSEKEAAERGAEHFSVETEDVDVKLGRDRGDKDCFYVSEKEHYASAFTR